MSSAHTPAIVFQPEGLRIEPDVTDLTRFRAWAHSDRFPERGRIDWLDGVMEVDVAPEDLNSHASVKASIAAALVDHVEGGDLGAVYIDSTRYSAPEAGLSVEPDVLVVLFDSLAAGRVRLVPRVGHTDRYAELEGRVDLVVECVSDSSVRKDTERLLELYERAGVGEYWLVDARGSEPLLSLYTRGDRGFELRRPDDDGLHRSAVLGMRVGLVRLPERLGIIRYRLRLVE